MAPPIFYRGNLTRPDPELERELAELRSGIRRETVRLLADIAIALAIIGFVAALIWRAS